MIEHREPTRIETGERPLGERRPSRSAVREGAAPDGSGRFRISRRGKRVVAWSLGVLLVFVSYARIVPAVVDWLHARPSRSRAFRDVELDPPPPPWIRPGAAGLLEHVRLRGKYPKSLAVLDLDLDAFLNDFRLLSPWVEDVREVRRFSPNGLVVRLSYRKPVAVVKFRGSSSAENLVVDREGYLLPVDEIESKALGSLIEIIAKARPNELRAGELWPRLDSDPNAQKRLLGAAKLSGFLAAKLDQEKSLPKALRLDVVHADSDTGLWVQNDLKTLVFWNEPPGEESPGTPTAERKWELLKQRHDRGGSLSAASPRFLQFSGDEVEIREGRNPS